MTNTTNTEVPAGQRVWVLSIEHKHGVNTSVHTSEAGARKALVEYVDEWWDDEMPGPRPEGDDEMALGHYFEHVETESYTINVAELSGSPSEAPDWQETIEQIEATLNAMSEDDRNDAIEALRSRFDEGLYTRER